MDDALAKYYCEMLTEKYDTEHFYSHINLQTGISTPDWTQIQIKRGGSRVDIWYMKKSVSVGGASTGGINPSTNERTKGILTRYGKKLLDAKGLPTGGCIIHYDKTYILYADPDFEQKLIEAIESRLKPE